MGANRFLELYERGRIHDQRSLTRAWHELVKRTHPDATGDGQSATLFDQIRAEYQEARILIGQSTIQTPEPETEETDQSQILTSLYQELNDIMRRGFPLDPKNPRIASTYFKSREVMRYCLDSLIRVDLFQDFEREMLELKTNSTYFTTGPLIPVLYRICDYHCQGDYTGANFARKEWPRMERILTRRNKQAIVEFLSFLMEQLS